MPLQRSLSLNDFSKVNWWDSPAAALELMGAAQRQNQRAVAQPYEIRQANEQSRLNNLRMQLEDARLSSYGQPKPLSAMDMERINLLKANQRLVNAKVDSELNSQNYEGALPQKFIVEGSPGLNETVLDPEALTVPDWMNGSDKSIMDSDYRDQNNAENPLWEDASLLTDPQNQSRAPLVPLKKGEPNLNAEFDDYRNPKAKVSLEDISLIPLAPKWAKTSQTVFEDSPIPEPYSGGVIDFNIEPTSAEVKEGIIATPVYSQDTKELIGHNVPSGNKGQSTYQKLEKPGKGSSSSGIEAGERKFETREEADAVAQEALNGGADVTITQDTQGYYRLTIKKKAEIDPRTTRNFNQRRSDEIKNYENFSPKVALVGKGEIPGTEEIQGRLDAIVDAAGGYENLSPQALATHVFSFVKSNDKNSAVLQAEYDAAAQRLGMLDKWRLFAEKIKTGAPILASQAKDIHDMIKINNAYNKKVVFDDLIDREKIFNDLNIDLVSVNLPKKVRAEYELYKMNKAAKENLYQEYMPKFNAAGGRATEAGEAIYQEFQTKLNALKATP